MVKSTEDMIWTLMPAIGVVIVYAIARLASFRVLRPLVAGGSASAFAGLVGLFLSPRCLCRDPVELIEGSIAFAVAWGAIVGVLFFLGFKSFRKG